MARFCTKCSHSFPSASAFTRHKNSQHRNPKPQAPRSTFKYHEYLNAQPCDEHGQFLPRNSAPPPLDDSMDWEPFDDRPLFEFAELIFDKMQSSKADVDQLLQILAAKNIVDGGGNAIFENNAHLEASIDAIKYGEVNWHSFSVRYNGPIAHNAPSWKRATYTVHTRCSLDVARSMAGSADFDGNFDYVPFEEYTAPDCRRYSNLMSGRWAYKQADVIAQDPDTHGSMIVPVVFGADKTTVSVASGNQEFHPVYMSLGNIRNEMCRAHRDAVMPLAFLAIPKAGRESADDDEFRLFKKQLYHASLARILEPLRPGMTTPEVLRCPDGHFRRAIFELGPFIADYPEQVFLAGIVQGWCPKCQAAPNELDGEGIPRFREHTRCLIDTFKLDTLWDTFGVIGDVVPFTNRFPRADIHELITPDLLHQLIKGTFKDHLVSWVESYVHATAESERDAKRIMDDIDRRIAIVPAFPGLRRFPEGRNFKQWTGNDSKALMKVFLPAIVGHVPNKMVRCIAAFLDFCYVARRSAHDTAALAAMDAALGRFHEHRTIFEEAGIRPDGISLPRQHSLLHYVRGIKLFGSPNSICSSITESKHITAVKRPWRRSNRNNPLGQIIRTNTRLSKISAARVEFGRRSMLTDDVVSHSLRAAGIDVTDDEDSDSDDGDVTDVDAYSRKITMLADEVSRPNLPELVCRFLHDQRYPDSDVPAEYIPLDDCPSFEGRVSVFHSACATFYAPSELSGPGGMQREIIRSNPSWHGQYARYDTVLIQNDPDVEGMAGMLVGRVLLFLGFTHEDVHYPCALVEWLLPEHDAPDPVTGMWVVKPEIVGGIQTVGLVHLDCIVRACHLIGVYGQTRIPVDFHFEDSLDAFKAFYVNRYADYHSHECIV
ncbi:hypothetical protein BD410DRAFT_726969 [Rickenella mellea]|uniref:C2H2-type domain-containing protein n=1 Tax=Rickenella mellea TaxID=50990 RepID=A0A4Y7PX06_9AGAM|nr:hypothetical protein BD410DRAFT_726969 [Rickenella mellea]